MAGNHHTRSSTAVYGMAAKASRAGGLSVLRERYQEFIEIMSAGGGHLLAFHSPCCNTLTKTLAPEDGDVWDSTSTCPWCGRLYNKVVTRDAVDAFNPPANLS